MAKDDLFDFTNEGYFHNTVNFNVDKVELFLY